MVEIQRMEAREVYVVRNHASDGLPRLVGRILELFDGQRPLQQVLRRVGVSHRRGRAVVRKLTSMGVIEIVEPLTRPRHFTEQEEAFFASEVEPIDACDLPLPNLGERVRSLLGRLRRS